MPDIHSPPCPTQPCHYGNSSPISLAGSDLKTSVDEAGKTATDFLSYEKARLSGEFNMIMDAYKVMSEYSIDKDTYWDIIRNYSELSKKYL